jgi:hypothetical protein
MEIDAEASIHDGHQIKKGDSEQPSLAKPIIEHMFLSVKTIGWNYKQRAVSTHSNEANEVLQPSYPSRRGKHLLYERMSCWKGSQNGIANRAGKERPTRLFFPLLPACPNSRPYIKQGFFKIIIPRSVVIARRALYARRLRSIPVGSNPTERSARLIV